MSDDAKKPVIVYGAEWCAFCHVAMEYFDKKGVAYEYRDVEAKDEWLHEAVSKSHQNAIPVLDFGNNQIVVGFDRPKIDTLIAA